MTEASQQSPDEQVFSELDLPQWSLVSFDAVEGSGLNYREAVELLEEKERAGVYGLCIVTDETAERMPSSR